MVGMHTLIVPKFGHRLMEDTSFGAGRSVLLSTTVVVSVALFQTFVHYCAHLNNSEREAKVVVVVIMAICKRRTFQHHFTGASEQLLVRLTKWNRCREILTNAAKHKGTIL